MTGWVWPLDSVQGFFESFWNSINQGLASLGNQLGAGLNNLAAGFNDALSRARIGIEGFIGQLGSQITEGLKGAFEAIGTALQVFWAWFRDNILSPILAAIQAALEAGLQFIKDLAKGFIDMIRQMAPHSPQGGLEAGLIALGLAAGVSVLAAGAATAIDAIHPFHSLEIKQLVFEGLRTTGIATIGPAVMGAIFSRAILKPMEQELNEMFVREVPGPGDLVRFVVREQISPEELNLWLARQGFNPKWAQAFWGAHWVIPSREEAVELYHRGLYSLQDVTENLQVNDRRPDTIPDLLALTFRTPSRAELERIAEVADVPEDTLKAWLRADGVSDELMPTYLSLVRGRRLIRILTRVESLVRTEVQAGRMVLEEARGLMQEFGFAEVVIAAELKVASRARDLEYRDELRGVFVEAFKKGELTGSDLAGELLALGFDTERVGTLVALEQFRKLPKPKVTA